MATIRYALMLIRSLGLHSVFAQALEGFDAKLLLDPLEEELDLSAGFIDFRDHNGVDFEYVGHED